jgi:hypothetical protein
MMDRRQVLTRLPLVPVAVTGLTTETLAAAAPSELMRLFEEWDACDRGAWLVESVEQSDALCDQMRRIETAMLAIPATTAAEYAAKIVALTSYGDWMPSRKFIAESARLCGASRASEPASATAERDL